MPRLEQRYRDSGLVLEKVFLGVRSDVLAWLTIQTYYAHKDKFYKDHEVWHLLVVDVILHTKLGPFKMSDRSGNEWQLEPAADVSFYRYRNNLDLHFNPGVRWFRLWAADEVRFDSDQKRMNMNDAKAGVEFVVDNRFHIKAFYDLESKRRSSDHWTNTNVFQVMLVARLGSTKGPTWHGHE